MNARITIQALALLLVLVVVAGDANKVQAQNSVAFDGPLAYFTMLDAESAYHNEEYGEDILYLDIGLVDSRLLTCDDCLLESYCVGSTFTDTLYIYEEPDEYHVQSSCGDSTRDGDIQVVDVYEFRSVFEGAQSPTELVIGEEKGLAVGSDLIVVNPVSLIVDERSRSGVRAMATPTALAYAIEKVKDIHSRYQNRRIVVRINTASHIYWYYRHQVPDLMSMGHVRFAFSRGSNECKDWLPSASSIIHELSNEGVIFVADVGGDHPSGFGWPDTLGSDLFQQYPACLSEVVAVAQAFPSDSVQSIPPFIIPASLYGASLSAPWIIEKDANEKWLGGRPDRPSAIASATAIALLSRYPTLTPEQVRRAMEMGGIRTGPHHGFPEVSFIQLEGALEAAGTLVDVEKGPELPDKASALELYPNPYTGGLLHIVDAGVAEWEHQEVEVFDLLGRRVKILKDRDVSLDDLSPGRYFVRSTKTGTTKILTIVK